MPLTHLLNTPLKPMKTLIKTEPVWIVGTGLFGMNLSDTLEKNGFTIAGFIETNPTALEKRGHLIHSWETLPACACTAQLAIGIFNHRTPFDTVMAQAQKAGFSAIFTPLDLYDQFASDLGFRYWLSTQDALKQQLSRIQTVALALADEESQTTLARICAFRLGLDYSFASEHSKQAPYFNELSLPSLLNKSITYVDCGAYNGDSWLALQQEPQVDCRFAYLLEPEPTNYDALVKTAQTVSHEAICLPLCAAEKQGLLPFATGLAEASTCYGNGDYQATSIALDALLPNTHVDFIKLDIEGFEKKALQGAAMLIKRSRPVLALSLYHKPSDLWELPTLLFDLCTNYTYYIRQHRYNSFECILYAIPSR